MGYVAAAWAHLATYGTMMILSYILGQKFYPIPYDVMKIMLYIAVAVAMGYVSWYVLGGNVWIGNVFVVLYCVMVALVERKSIMAVVSKKR
ncbi:MAG: hypothetical protein II288_00900 [Alistipes sp.]|nr:hypothetical protein [Alistipes sp.]